MKKSYMVMLTVLVLVACCVIPLAWAAYRADRVKLVAGPHSTGVIQDAPAGETGTPVFPTLGKAESLFRSHVESTAIVDGGTSVKTVGDFSPLAAEWSDGGVVTVSCGGTLGSGTNDVKGLYLTLEGTTLTTTTSVAADVGDWSYTATVVNDGATTQKAISALLIDGATVKSDYATRAVTISGTPDFLLRVVLANTSDKLTKELCVWTYKP